MCLSPSLARCWTEASTPLWPWPLLDRCCDLRRWSVGRKERLCVLDVEILVAGMKSAADTSTATRRGLPVPRGIGARLFLRQELASILNIFLHYSYHHLHLEPQHTRTWNWLHIDYNVGILSDLASMIFPTHSVAYWPSRVLILWRRLRAISSL